MNISTLAGIAILAGIGLNIIQNQNKNSKLSEAQKVAQILGLPINKIDSQYTPKPLTQKQNNLINEENFGNKAGNFDGILNAVSSDPETAIMKNISGTIPTSPEDNLNVLYNFLNTNSDKVCLLLFTVLWCNNCKNTVKELADPNIVKLIQKTMPKLMIGHIDLFFIYNKAMVSTNTKSKPKILIDSTPSYAFVKISNGKINQLSEIIKITSWKSPSELAKVKVLYDFFKKNS